LSGIPFYTLGVFVDPLRRAFGWQVASIQSCLTVSYLTTMMTLPAVGWLANRVGVRIVAICSLVFMSFAFMGMAFQDQNLWRFYVNWFLLALGGTGSLAITWTKPLASALQAARGMGLGLSLLGTGVIGMLGPPISRMLIDSFGWRMAYVCLGAAPLIIAVPVAFFFFHDPTPLRSTVRATRPFANPKLWVLGAIFVLLAAGVTGVVPNLIKILTSEGVHRNEAILVSSTIGLFVMAGRLLCGVLVDRFWAPGVAIGFIALSALGCSLLAMGATAHGAGFLAAALVGLTVGAEFDLMPFLVSRYLPQEHFTGSLAAISACFYLGAAISGPGLAIFFDLFGSYRAGLCISIAFFAFAAIALAVLGPYANPIPLRSAARRPMLRSRHTSRGLACNICRRFF
jgi:MFS family permease